jgi:hypothetical protein
MSDPTANQDPIPLTALAVTGIQTGAGGLEIPLFGQANPLLDR